MFYFFVTCSLQVMTPIPVLRRTYWTRTPELLRHVMKELSRCAILRCDPMTGILM